MTTWPRHWPALMVLLLLMAAGTAADHAGSVARGQHSAPRRVADAMGRPHAAPAGDERGRAAFCGAIPWRHRALQRRRARDRAAPRRAAHAHAASGGGLLPRPGLRPCGTRLEHDAQQRLWRCFEAQGRDGQAIRRRSLFTFKVSVTYCSSSGSQCTFEKNVKLKSEVIPTMIFSIAVIVIAALVVERDPVEGHPDIRQPLLRPWCETAPADARGHRRERFRVAWGWLIFLALGAAGFLLKRYYDTENGRLVIDAIMLKLPVLGNIIRKVSVARFCRTLSTLLSSGVPILDGLDITARTSGNAIIERAIIADPERHRARRDRVRDHCARPGSSRRWWSR